MLLSSFFTIFFSFTWFIISVNCRGRMIDPPHRGSMWRYGFDTPQDYNDMSLNCGGISVQWKQNNGKCGLCGDPYGSDVYDHEPGGKYATGVISKTYEEGKKIDITIELTANKMGWFEFRLCQNDEAMKKIDQDCLDNNLLKVLNNKKGRKKRTDDDYRFYVVDKNEKKFVVEIQLPDGLFCKYCVLQFRYHAGNNYGTSKDGKSCLGCAEEQEELYNCADIEILQNINKLLKIEVLNTTEAVKSTTEALKSDLSMKILNKNLIIFLVLFVFF